MSSPLAVAAILFLQISIGVPGIEAATATESRGLTLEDDLVIGLDADGIVLGRIVDVAVGSQGRIYVLDASAPTVHMFTGDGGYLASIGRSGEAPGEFYAPACLAIGPDDHLYVAGADLYIEVFDADGAPVDRLNRVNTNPAQSLAVDEYGDIYVVALNLLDQKMIHKYAGRSGQLLASFCDSYASGHDVDTREEAFFAQGSIAVDNGWVYYVQSYPHLIRTFDLSGTLVNEFDARTAESKAPRTSVTPDGVQLEVPASFSRTIVPLDREQLLTILGLPFEGIGGTGYLDLYRHSDGARIASIENPPTVSISCRDSRGRLYSAQARDNVPVVVRYRLMGAPEVETGSR